jgi:hypothetical protein
VELGTKKMVAASYSYLNAGNVTRGKQQQRASNRCQSNLAIKNQQSTEGGENHRGNNSLPLSLWCEAYGTAIRVMV